MKLESRRGHRGLGLLMAVVCCLLCYVPAKAQFYYTGRGSASLKWEQIKAPDYQLLYPSGFRPTALGVAAFMDTISPYIGYNFPGPVKRIPIILRTENMRSNGYVTWAPKHGELITAPPTSGFAVPWLKQLSVHEWRHVVQMSNMKHGLTKIATWVLGEAGISLGLLAVSGWLLEGDATLAETQFSEFGRGKQPSFSMEYRALASTGQLGRMMHDKLICGSYKTMIPDIYKFGYQITTAGETYHSPTLWGDIIKYSGKWPIFVVPDHFYLKKHFNTTIRELTKRTFKELDQYWAQSLIPNNYNLLTLPTKNYTTYKYPMADPTTGGESVVAIKSQFYCPTKFIRFDPRSGTEKRIRYTGSMSSRPVIQGNTMYWTEHKSHPIWEQSSFSQIKSMDLATGKAKSARRWGRNFYVTPLRANGFAFSSLDEQSANYLVLSDSCFNSVAEYRFDEATEIQGLASNAKGDELFFLALDHSGVWIGGVEIRRDDTGLSFGRVRTIRKPSVVSMANLSSSGERLYFESIASGKDEIHTIDTRTLREDRITGSTFGAFMPSVAQGDSTLWMSGYTSGGYMLAKTKATKSVEQVEWSRLPKDILNPPRYQWQVPKIDSIRITPNAPTHHHKLKRYSKAGRWFNVHSWAPVAFDGDFIDMRTDLLISFGLTAFFQSTMGDMRGFFTYSPTHKGDWMKGRFIYTGLPVQFNFVGEYGGGNQGVYGLYQNLGDELLRDPFSKYMSLGVGASMPLNFSSGAWYRTLNPSFQYAYTNARLYHTAREYTTGLHQYSASLYWSQNMAMAYQNLRPKFGYAVRGAVLSGFNKDFGLTSSLWVSGYLPGIWRNHSLALQTLFSYQTDERYKSSSKLITLKGVYNPYAAKGYIAATAEYALPLAYPDWGWDGKLYIKRLWINLYGGYSRGEYFNGSGYTTRRHNSLAVDLTVDYNLFRAFDLTTTFTLAKPSNIKGVWFGVGFNFKF